MNKELALASQNKLIVVPLRIEDVAPNDAFAYEFATRQWIDFFADWEFAIEQLAQRISSATREASPERPAAEAPPSTPKPAVELDKDAALKSATRLPDVSGSAPEAAPEESRTFAVASESEAANLDDALETPATPVAAARTRRTALYVGLSLAALAAVAIGLATPSLMRSKTATAEPRAMTALLPTAPPSAVRRVSVEAAPTAADAAVTATAAADAAPPDGEPVKVAKKKKSKALTAADTDVPY
jgi:hypothetical protein